MTHLENYLQDGANYQARATLMFLQRNANIESSWNNEYNCYDAEIKVARWENCREQGYIVSLCSKKFGGGKQLNIAFFEHRNSDKICAVKWEQNSINTITINDADFGDAYNDKFDTSHSVGCGKAYQMAEWIRKQLIKFWDKHNTKN